MTDPVLAHSPQIFKNNFKKPTIWPITVTEWHRRNNFPQLPSHLRQESFETLERHTGGCLKHLHRTGRYHTGLVGDGFLVGTTAVGCIEQPKAVKQPGESGPSVPPALAGQLTDRFCRSKQKMRLLISELLHQRFFH